MVLSVNLVALTVLLIGFSNKFGKRAPLPAMIAQYRIVSLAQAKALAPFLLMTELGVVALGVCFMVFGQWGSVSALLLAVYLSYCALLTSAKLRAIPMQDCGCSLANHQEGANVIAILTRNGLLAVLLVFAGMCSASVALVAPTVVLSLLVSVLSIVALTGFEALMVNAEKLKGLKVYHG
ncbi:MauE/DoxX family redox-associated membrane protein [Halioxenophilus aromaticivorans]|uniref:MauE/DoxX family redox-associated membrane protein n=1 Tax=Halioxenophilus aromaticivorans TaxID=1306992 RepID=UPI0031EABCFC